jgi:hypothetical protein
MDQHSGVASLVRAGSTHEYKRSCGQPGVSVPSGSTARKHKPGRLPGRGGPEIQSPLSILQQRKSRPTRFREWEGGLISLREGLPRVRVLEMVEHWSPACPKRGRCSGRFTFPSFQTTACVCSHGCLEDHPLVGA